MSTYLGLLAFVMLYGASQFGAPIAFVYCAYHPKTTNAKKLLLAFAAASAVIAYLFWHAEIGLELQSTLVFP